MNDIEDFINKKKKEGFRIGFSVDIRKVENFFKRLFGKNKDDDEEKEDGKRRKKRDN